MKKTSLFLAMSAAVALTIGGTGAVKVADFADLEPVTLHVANTAPEKASVNVYCQAFEEALERITDGKAQVEVHFGGTIGSDRETLESVQMDGDVDMVAVFSGSAVPNFVPAVAAADMPMIYQDYDLETIQAVFDGAWGDALREEFAGKGFKLLDLWTGRAFRDFATNKEINTPDDLNGLRIRVAENPYHMAFWTATGATPTPLAFGEVYMALQQGLLDAHENPSEVIFFSNMYEQQKIMYTNAQTTMISVVFVMNEGVFENLPEAYQQAYLEACAEARAAGAASYQNNQESAAYDALANDVGPEWLENLKAALAEEAAK